MAWPNQTNRPDKPPVDRVVLILVAVAAGMLVYGIRDGRISTNDIYHFAVLIPAIVLHEVSHGWIANRWGDPTARNAGRLTLNPVRHIDPFGSILLPGVLIFLQYPAFGYAKPVPVNTQHMTKNKAMMVSLAGPASNIVLAAITTVAIHLLFGPLDLNSPVIKVLYFFGLTNVVLAVFNLIPMPPLDGSAVIERFLPARYWSTYMQIRQYSVLILFALVMFGGKGLSYIFDPAVNFWFNLLP